MVDDQSSPLSASTSAVRNPARAAIAATVSPACTVQLSGTDAGTRTDDALVAPSARDPLSAASRRGPLCSPGRVDSTACAGEAPNRNASEPAIATGTPAATAR